MDLKEDIELRNNLSNLYLRAERLMSMRSTSSESVEAVASLIQTTLEKLLEILKSDKILDSEEIDAVIKNNHEFNARFKDWLKSKSTSDATSSTKVVEDTLSFLDLDVAPSKSLTSSVITSSSRFTSSSRSTVKRREAYAKMKLLELEAAHEEERALEEAKRAKEDFERKRRETKRKLDLAALEFKLWDSNLCENEFPKTNTSDVSAESQRPVVLKEQTVSNIVSTVSVLTTASITASKRGASSHVLKGEQPIPPACLSSANGTSFSALPNADLGVNFYAPPPVVTTFSTPPMQNALMQRDYGTNSSFPRDPFSSAPNPSFHQQSVWSGPRGAWREGLPFLTQEQMTAWYNHVGFRQFLSTLFCATLEITSFCPGLSFLSLMETR